MPASAASWVVKDWLDKERCVIPAFGNAVELFLLIVSEYA